MRSLRGMMSFVQTAESGSFTAAGLTLGISAVAVGKNVSALEAELGVRLFQRSTRQLRLTNEGMLLLEQCKPPMQELEFAHRTVQQLGKSPAGPVRITSVTPFGRGLVQPVLTQFSALYPRIQIDLMLDDKVVDMIAEGYDIGIRVGQMDQPNLIARNIAALPFIVVAAPSYLKAHGAPTHPSQLAQHNCLCVKNSKTKALTVSDRACTWRLANCDGLLSVPVQGNLATNDMATVLASALQGQGLFYAPLPLVTPYLRRGELKLVLPVWAGRGANVFLHYPNRRNLPARVKILVDFLLEKLRIHPDLNLNIDADLKAWAATP
jgi:DNA-binding transcriptional LysR family regulator